MKMASIYIDKQMIAEKLGVDAKDFIFGDVVSDMHGIEFRVIVDSAAEIKETGSIIIEDDKGNHWNLRRQKLSDLDE